MTHRIGRRQLSESGCWTSRDEVGASSFHALKDVGSSSMQNIIKTDTIGQCHKPSSDRLWHIPFLTVDIAETLLDRQRC